MKTFYRMDKECIIETLSYPAICTNAAFKLDKPLRIDPSDELELNDGQWFLHTQSIRVPLPGRWISR